MSGKGGSIDCVGVGEKRAIADKWGGSRSCGGSDWGMHEPLGGVVIIAIGSRQERRPETMGAINVRNSSFDGATECEVRCQANALAGGCVG